MDFKEITDLITIKQYMQNTSQSFSIDRATSNTLNNMVILLDKKIIELLQDNAFKDYIGYKDVKKAVEDVVKMNNIKSGLVKK